MDHLLLTMKIFMNEVIVKRYFIRKIIPVIILICCLPLLIKMLLLLIQSGLLAGDDFIEYWAAAKIHRQAQNPYDPQLMLSVQSTLNQERTEPLMMWNPPWILATLYPFGIFQYGAGRILWLLICIAMIFISSHWMWTQYYGSSSRLWLSWIITFSFAPTLFALRIGQITPFLLVGLIGFIHFGKIKSFWIAGIFMFFLSFKPQLLYLVWLAFLVWIISNRKWQTGLGFVLCLSLASLSTSYINPKIFSYYLSAIWSTPPVYFVTPTFGGLLRYFFGFEHIWLQFFPSIMGLLWFIPYWVRNNKDWIWEDQIPVLVFVSLLTTTYAWTFDYLLLLPIVISLFASFTTKSFKRHGKFVGLYTSINLTALILNFASVLDIWFFWFIPLIGALYILAERSLNKKQAGNQYPIIVIS
jgi:hypothetical protein